MGELRVAILVSGFGGRFRGAGLRGDFRGAVLMSGFGGRFGARRLW